MNWKIRTFVTAFALALLFGSATNSVACAWSEEWEMTGYRFYQPEFTDLAEFSPFHFTFERLYDYHLMEDTTSSKANIEAWKKYLGAGIKESDIEDLVYVLSADELMSLKKELSTKSPVADRLASNTLVAQWKSGRRLEVLDYLILAHQAEPYCLYDDPWAEEEREMDGVEAVINAAKAGAASASDSFLKLRYAYQTIRLLQYAGQPQAATEIYRKNALPNLDADPLLAAWTMCHYAGCLRAQELEAEAAYTFSRVFDACPSRRIQAWYGWRILSDEIWESVQAKCKNNHEMATIFFLQGYSPEALSIEAMRQIQELEPGSKMLEILLLREINKLESTMLGYPYNVEKPMAERLGSDNATQLLNFVDEVMASGKMHDRSVWILGHSYLQFLNGKISSASSELTAKQSELSAEGKLKARLMDLVFRIVGTKTVDRTVENTIFKDFTNLSSKISDEDSASLGRFRDETFAWLYESQGEKAKALLALQRGYQITNYPINIALVDDMIAFEAKPEKTLYEKQLLTWLGGTEHKDLLLDIKGTGLLGRNLLPEAIKVFQLISEDYRTKSESFQLDANPFRTVTTDVVNCENCGAGEYNKLTYAETMLELQKKALADPSNAAEYNMAIGNGYYNTTYFGPAWNARDFYRSGGSWYNMGGNEWTDFDIDTFEEAVDMSLPMDFYMKALNASKDKEMGAMAAFMVAKCELNQSYVDGGKSMKTSNKGFETLKENYKKTAMYKRFIKECLYFLSYAGGK